MGYTEQITIEPDGLPPKDFKIFTHLPYRVGAEFQKGLVAMARTAGFDEIRKFADVDMDTEGVSVPDIDIDFDQLRAVQELLLKRAVVNPKITEEVLSDDRHELQPYLKILAEELMDRYQSNFKKKGSRNGSS